MHVCYVLLGCDVSSRFRSELFCHYSFGPHHVKSTSRAASLLAIVGRYALGHRREAGSSTSGHEEQSTTGNVWRVCVQVALRDAF